MIVVLLTGSVYGAESLFGDTLSYHSRLQQFEVLILFESTLSAR